MNVLDRLKGKSEKRQHDRQLFKISDNFKLRIFEDDTDIYVIDLDPISLGIASEYPIIKGDKISFYLTYNKNKISSLLIGNLSYHGKIEFQKKYYHKYIVQWEQESIDYISDSFYIPIVFQPQAYCDHPFNLEEKVCFRIVGFQKNGCILSTSIRNKGFFKGLEFTISILMPFAGEYKIRCTVTRVYTASEYFLIELQFAPHNESFLFIASEYLLGFCESGPDLRVLKESGFSVNESAIGIRIKDVKTIHEWHEVLKVRKVAYQNVGKMTDIKSFLDAEDEFDSYARKFLVTMNRTIIGGFRIVFPNGDLSKSEHHKLGLEIPDWIVKGGFAELSRISVLPDYQSRDVFFSILRMVTLTLVSEPSVNFMLGNCNPKEWFVYKHLGSVKIGPPFSAFGRDDCQLVYTDISKAISGKKIRPTPSSLAIYAHIGEPVRQKLDLKFWGLNNQFVRFLMLKLRRSFSKLWRIKQIKDSRKNLVNKPK